MLADAFNKEKVLVEAFSWHCEISRRPISSPWFCLSEESLGWLGLASWLAAAGGLMVGTGDTRLRFATLMQDLGYRVIT